MGRAWTHVMQVCVLFLFRIMARRLALVVQTDLFAGRAAFAVQAGVSISSLRCPLRCLLRCPLRCPQDGISDFLHLELEMRCDCWREGWILCTLFVAMLISRCGFESQTK